MARFTSELVAAIAITLLLPAAVHAQITRFDRTSSNRRPLMANASVMSVDTSACAASSRDRSTRLTLDTPTSSTLTVRHETTRAESSIAPRLKSTGQ